MITCAAAKAITELLLVARASNGLQAVLHQRPFKFNSPILPKAKKHHTELHLKKCFEAQCAKAALLSQKGSRSLALLDMITTRASCHCQCDTKLTWQYTAYGSAMHPFQVQVSQLHLRCICFMLGSFHQDRECFQLSPQSMRSVKSNKLLPIASKASKVTWATATYRVLRS